MQPPSDFSGITASSGIAELTALRRAYAAGALSPRQVVDMLVAKSGEYDEYNVWIIPPAQMPLQSYLERLDNLDPGDTQRYPLWGIPFAIKDNIDLAGVCTTAGCPGYSYLPDKNATVVQRLIEAGAIPVGKTNLDQFATGLVGTRSPYGECCNALRPELLSGGSSSGSAVSVALGLASFALGSDTAGSGRVPAALNGIYGLKPPRGSWSNSGLVPACASLDCITVFANSLADLQLVDSVASGYDSNCPWSRDDLQRSGGGGGDIVANSADLPAVIYLPAEQPRFFGPFAQSYQQRWLAFTTRLREAAQRSGLAVELLDTAWLSKVASILYDGPWVAERWSDLGDFVEANPGAVLPVTETILRQGANSSLTAAAAFSAMHQVQQARARCREQLRESVLILPTCGGTFSREEVRQDPIQTNSLMGLYTNHCNLCDLTALAIPTDQPGCDLPFGVTLFAPAQNQARLMAVANMLERV